jgi:hypothetical protein
LPAEVPEVPDFPFADPFLLAAFLPGALLTVGLPECTAPFDPTLSDGAAPLAAPFGEA